MKRFGISKKLVLVFLIASPLPLAILAYIYITNFDTLLQEEIQGRLSEIAERKSEKIELFFNERTRDSTIMAKRESTMDAFSALRESFYQFGPDSIDYRHKDSYSHKLFQEYTETYGYYDLLLIDMSGTIIFSMAHEKDFNTNLRSGPYKNTNIAKGFDSAVRYLDTSNTDFVPYAPSNNKLAGFITSPLMKKNRLVGVLAVQINIDKLESLLLDREGLGATGETLFAKAENDKVLYTLPLRYHPDASYGFSSQDNRLASWNAVRGEHGAGESVDYRGEKVIGAWRYIPSLNWGMVVKMDVSEAMQPVADAMELSIIILVTMIVASGIGAYALSITIVSPIRRLIRVTDEIASGNLDKRVPEDGNDEIAALASSFNIMAYSLQEYYATLDMRIRERTEELHKTNERLKENQKRMLKAEEIAHFGNWDWNIYSGSIKWSDEVFRIFGLLPQQIIATYDAFIERIHPDDKQLVINAVDKCLTENMPYNIEHRIITPDGSERFVHETGIVTRDMNGTPINMIGVVQDISERKKIQKELSTISSRLMLATQVGRIGVWDWDIVNNILAWDETMYRLYSLPGHDALVPFEVWEKSIHPDDRQKTIERLQMAVRGEADYDEEFRIVWPDGEVRVIKPTALVLRDSKGNAYRMIGVNYDITDSKKAEEKINAAKDAAEAANMAKSEFLANMSHEIRTPMNAIIGFGYLLLQNELDPKHRDYVAKMHSAAHSLLGIINDILDFSKIEAGMLELEAVRFDLSNVMERIGDLVTFSAEEKGLEVMFYVAPDVPRHIVGDQLRLGQVLTNLVNNAIKFTERGEVVISIERVGLGVDSVTLKFSISDTGIGMTESQISGLFRPFTQADTSITRRFGGTGLGLTICKRLVEKMGGQIQVKSKLGKGSTFYFIASFSVGPETEDHRYLPPSDLAGLRMLVVDDNPAAREVLSKTLSAFSFSVTSVDSGAAAIEELERVFSNRDEKPYRLVFMDWKMPDMDGFAAADRIRTNKGILHPPVIIMITAFGREEVKQRAEEAGIKALISKPVHPSTLFNTILDALGRRVVKGSGNLSAGLEMEKKLSRIKGANILVAEDHPVNQLIAKDILEKAGMKVFIAGTGREAVSMIDRGTCYDAVLMDLQMPEMDGYEATKLIRNNGCKTPIIAITAHALSEEVEKCLAAGMNDHLSKPIDPEKLYSTLIKWIRPVVYSEAKIAGEALTPQNSGNDLLPMVLPGIDIESGLRRTGGNQQLFKTLLLNFIEMETTKFKELRNAVNKKDLIKAGEIAHRLKGLSGNISANRVFDILIKIETILRTGKAHQLSHLVDELEEGLKEVFESVKTIKNIPESASMATVGSIDSGLLSLLITELMEMLKTHNLQAGDLMTTLRDSLAGRGVDFELGQLIELINRLNFKEAEEALSSLSYKTGNILKGGPHDGS